jgi:AcrR family transcriptional regulator
MTLEATSPRRMDATQRRELILRSAMRLFEQQPYNDVSLGDVAKDAGIGRPLIHHYFGTKRDLYIEVIRRLSYVPAVAVRSVAHGTLEERVDAAIDRWLTVARRHRNLWSATVSVEGPGLDREIERIQEEANLVAVERMLEALGLAEVQPGGEVLRTLVLAYGGMAKTTSRQWLVNQSLTREQAHALLTKTLLTIIREVAPAFGFPPSATTSVAASPPGADRRRPGRSTPR